MKIINCVVSTFVFLEMFLTPDITPQHCAARDIQLHFHYSIWHNPHESSRYCILTFMAINILDKNENLHFDKISSSSWSKNCKPSWPSPSSSLNVGSWWREALRARRVYIYNLLLKPSSLTPWTVLESRFRVQSLDPWSVLSVVVPPLYTLTSLSLGPSLHYSIKQTHWGRSLIEEGDVVVIWSSSH